jgi:hypothetical protein
MVQPQGVDAAQVVNALTQRCAVLVRELAVMEVQLADLRGQLEELEAPANALADKPGVTVGRPVSDSPQA